MEPVSLYLHIPFCERRCGYCDFNTYAGMGHLIPAYVDGLLREIDFYGKVNRRSEDRAAHTVFFGGGTPSLLPAAAFEKILSSIKTSFDLTEDCEVTIEANPGTLSKSYLLGLNRLGINRISLGVQSSNLNELKALDRLHGYPEAVMAAAAARGAGFENLSFDLIFGIPNQTMVSWSKSLDDVFRLKPEHLSLYALTVEDGTPLAHQVAAGAVVIPEDDLAAEMYEYARERLALEGFGQYEISNWARGELFQSRHNLQYWRNQPYIGMGAGAHGFDAGARYLNRSALGDYIRRLKMDVVSEDGASPAVVEQEKIDQFREMQETMMMGLRLVQEGVSEERFEARFGRSIEMVFGAEIDRLVRQDLVEWTAFPEKSLRLTHYGVLLGNRVFQEFV